MTSYRKTNAFFGFMAGIISAVFGGRTGKSTTQDLKQTDFSTSTQRTGVRFTDRIRDIFRFRWIKKQ